MNHTELSTKIIEGLEAAQQIKITMKETGRTRAELSTVLSFMNTNPPDDGPLRGGPKPYR